jgi:serine/threonine protein kinase
VKHLNTVKEYFGCQSLKETFPYLFKKLENDIEMDEIISCSGRLLTNCHPYLIKFGRLNRSGRLPVAYFAPSREQQSSGVEEAHARLPRHHTIVQFLGKGFSSSKQRVYWLYEQVPYTLEQLIREEQLSNLSVPELLQIALDIAQGIEIATRIGQVKRIDLRPANIWITEDFRAKLHGIEMHQHCGHGQMCSCSWFPEWQYHDVKNNNSDDMDDSLAWPTSARGANAQNGATRYSWTVGVILAELLHRRKFARRALTADILKNHESDYIPQNAPAEIKDMLKQCWRTNTNERITIGELVSTLRELIQKALAKQPPKETAASATAAADAVLRKAGMSARDALIARKQLKREMQDLIDKIRVEWQITNCADVAISEQQILGQGAFSTVYKGRWKSQLVAVKKYVSPTVSSDPAADRKRMLEIVDAFRHEVQTMMSLCSTQQQRFGGESYVVRFLGACKFPAFIVYELMPYNMRTVLSVQQKRFSQSIADQLKLLGAVTNSLAYLHSQRLPHLDLKPENIMMSPIRPAAHANGVAPSPRIREFDFEVKLSDISSTAVGSWPYKPPECLPSSERYRVEDDADIDPFKVDIWSLGIVLTEICSGSGQSGIFGELQEPGIAAEYEAAAEDEGSRHLPPRLFQAVESIYNDEIRSIAHQCLSVNPKTRPNARSVMRAIQSAEVSLVN